MKLFKYTVLALALAAGFTACSDNDDFVPGAASEGVYFPSDDPREIDLDRNESAFDVTVARAGDTDAATYALVGHADDEVFTLPTSVSFAQGETTATVSVAYRKDAMGLDKAYKVELGFAEGTQICNFGNPSLEMAVTLPAPWITVGKGTYRDVFILAATTLAQDPEFKPEWEVEIQQNEVDPLRFRWLNPYGENFAKFCAANGIGDLDPSEYDSAGKFSIEFLCDESGYVLIPLQSTGFEFFSDGIMYVLNEAGLSYPQKSYSQIIRETPEACGIATWGTEKDEETDKEIDVLNTVFMPAKTVLFTFDLDGAYIGGDGYCWWREGVEIKDYAITISYEGVLTTPKETNRAIASITLGEDIHHAKTGIVKTDDEAAALEAVLSDAVTVQELTDKNNPAVRYAFDGSGDYVIAVAAYNEEGEEVATQTLAISIADNSAPSDWISAGSGTYTDRYCMPMYGMGFDNSWTVAIEQNVTDPTIYRWVHPYGSVFAAYFKKAQNKDLSPAQYDSEDELYLQFQIKDGNVAVLSTDCGVLFNSGDGYMTVGNKAGYLISQGASFENALQRYPQFFGTAKFEGGKLVSVSEPEENVAVSFSNDPEGPYGIKDDEGGIQWLADGASAAQAKAPSLKRAMSSSALKVRSKFNDSDVKTVSLRTARKASSIL